MPDPREQVQEMDYLCARFCTICGAPCSHLKGTDVDTCRRGHHHPCGQRVREARDAERRARVVSDRAEIAELRRLLANATDPENRGDWDEAREVGWAYLAHGDEALEAKEDTAPARQIAGRDPCPPPPVDELDF